MNTRRILAVVTARNREFYRDKAGLGWNIFMPVVMVLGLAFIFSNPDETLYKVGVLGAPPAGQTAFLRTLHIRFIAQDDEAAAIDKVRYHRIDLLLDLRGAPRYWVNDLSPRGYIVERLLLQSYAQPAAGLTREAVSGRAVRYVDWVLPGVLAMNVMFSSLWGVGWVIVRYRKNGVLRRLRATPLTAGEFLVAQIISRLLVVSGVTVLVFAGTHALLDFPMRGSYLALGLVFFAGAIALVSLGLMVSARVRSEELADGLLNLMSWPMMIMSGVWFSLEGTNVWAQRIAEFLPLTHMVDAARRVMLDGAGLDEVGFEIAVLLGIGSVLLTLAARTFRWQ
ncbi:MAG: ABC transporter permease [Chromatiaceae bacterium]|jgi:ABC-type multidrug transport system permease subunit|nr:ABC transporter permease [Chromatiaceae bacterium]